MQRLKPVAPTHNLRAITIVQAVDRTREERTRCQPLFRSIRTRLAPIKGGGRGEGEGKGSISERELPRISGEQETR